MSEIIEKAKELIEEKAREYAPKKEICWLCWEDKKGIQHTLSARNHLDFCEDCIDNAVQETQRECDSGEFADEYGDEYDVVKPGTKITFQVETSPEKDFFCHCNKCDEVIEAGLILIAEEIEHWETLNENDLADPHACYELTEILNCYDEESYNDEIISLAKRIIRIKEGVSE